MATRRCGICSTNWPNTGGFTDCPLCGEGTTYSMNRAPDFTEAEAKEHVREVKAREVAARGKPTPEHADRVARYLKMKFSEVDAQVLALAKWTEGDSKGRKWVRPLDPLRVARALEGMAARGIPEAQALALAVDIFT
jgi:hypothetical protein